MQLSPKVYHILGHKASLNSQRINDPMKKLAIELNRAFQRKKYKWSKNT
jgi:hypothetical protein